MITSSTDRLESSLTPLATLIQQSSPLNVKMTGIEGCLSDKSLEMSANLNSPTESRLPLDISSKNGPGKPSKDSELGSLLSEQVEAQLSLGKPTCIERKCKNEYGPFQEMFKRAFLKNEGVVETHCPPNQLQTALSLGSSEFHIQDQQGSFTDVEESILVKRVRRRIQQKAIAR
ncbi:hypothetical protein SLA2020_253290 [Shorea laevis]